MVGWNVCRRPNGIRLYVGGKHGGEAKSSEHDPVTTVWLDEDTCRRLGESIRDARRRYWKVEKCGG